MSHVLEDTTLCHRVLNLVPADNFGLLERLQGIKLSVVLLLNQGHLTIRALANDTNSLEVVLGNVLSLNFLLLRDYFLILSIDLGRMLSELFFAHSIERTRVNVSRDKIGGLVNLLLRLGGIILGFAGVGHLCVHGCLLWFHFIFLKLRKVCFNL